MDIAEIKQTIIDRTKIINDCIGIIEKSTDLDKIIYNKNIAIEHIDWFIEAQKNGYPITSNPSPSVFKIKLLELYEKKLAFFTNEKSVNRPNLDKKLYRPVATGENVAYASLIPKTVNIGNLIFEKRYIEAIECGKKLLAMCDDYEYEGMIHINLMIAYFSIRSFDPSFFELSTYHAKQSVMCGHNTGFAQKRLVINLEKSGKINQAIQLCDLILSSKFHFSKFGNGSKDSFKKRRNRLMNKTSKADDNYNDILFSESEMKLIYERSK